MPAPGSRTRTSARRGGTWGGGASTGTRGRSTSCSRTGMPGRCRSASCGACTGSRAGARRSRCPRCREMLGRDFIPVRLAAMLVMVAAVGARGEDGSKLWLRYPGSADHARAIVVQGKSATCEIIRAELAAARVEGDDAIVVGTPGNSEVVRGLGWESELK